MKPFDICVVGGCGHVGLPLSIILAYKGLRVLVYDLNKAAIQKVQSGQMPFTEDDGDCYLNEALQKGTLHFTDCAADVSQAEALVITIGTPVDEFRNPKLNAIQECMDALLPYLEDDQLIILRSTVYPGSTNWLINYMTRQGRANPIAFCPERLVQGKGIKELQELPQIVSGSNEAAVERASAIFCAISPEIIVVSPLEAEFAKLFTNVYRYFQFAIANQLYMITTSAGVDYERVRHAVRHNYPRVKDLPSAGFAAGPCLYKDTAQLAAFFNNQFGLGDEAINVNEGLVYFVVDQIARKYPLDDMTVGILGMAFKSNIDDTRVSLSYKLKRVLYFRAKNVLCCDPLVVSDPNLLPTSEVIAQSDLLILATPHQEFKDLDFGGKPVVDIWNFYGHGTLI